MRTMFGLALVGLAGGLAAVARADDNHPGPHKGIVVEWGEEEYHPEIVVDAKTGTVTVYVYGNHDDLHKKKLKAIDSKELKLVLKNASPATTLKLEPKPEKDDPKGASTRFVATHEALKAATKWEGTLSGKVGTKPYSGDFGKK
jgi:serine/threonine protein kinase HipA of HipAB toxin-antitoxin module